MDLHLKFNKIGYGTGNTITPFGEYRIVHSNRYIPDNNSSISRFELEYFVYFYCYLAKVETKLNGIGMIEINNAIDFAQDHYRRNLAKVPFYVKIYNSNKNLFSKEITKSVIPEDDEIKWEQNILARSYVEI